MTEKDFSTIKKTLRVLQKVQATARVHSMWISHTRYADGKIAAGVTLFKKEGDACESFDFYNFLSPEERLEKYNEMMDFING